MYWYNTAVRVSSIHTLRHTKRTQQGHSRALLLELLEGDVEVEGLVAVVKGQPHEGVPTLSVLDLDDEIPAAVRDALHRPVRHLAHREQLAVPSGM